MTRMGGIRTGGKGIGTIGVMLVTDRIVHGIEKGTPVGQTGTRGWIDCQWQGRGMASCGWWRWHCGAGGREESEEAGKWRMKEGVCWRGVGRAAEGKMIRE